MLDIAHGLEYRVLLTKLVELYKDVYPYLAILIVALLAWTGEAQLVPEDMQITMMTWEAFYRMLMRGAGYNCDDYGLVRRQFLGVE